MKIVSVRADRYTVVADVPLGRVAEQTVVIASVTTDDGLVGYGLAGAPGLPGPTVDFVNRQVGPELEGLDPMHTEAIWSRLLERFNRRSLGGVWSFGVSAVDIALWDLKGQALGANVSTLLGGAYEQVPTYVTFGLAAYTDDELVEVARQMVAAGHTSLKMVVGGERRDYRTGPDRSPVRRQWDQVAVDERRVRAVREAVGPDVNLLLDGNCLFSLSDAKRLVGAVEDLGILWLEEPILRNDPTALHELRGSTRIPIAAGQNVGSLWGHRDLITARAVDVAQPNVCHVGGYTEALKVAALAQAHNLVLGHGGRWPYHNALLHGAVPNGGFVELHLAAWRTVELLYRDVPVIQDGYLTIPRAPGLGFMPNPDALDEYRVAGDDQ